MAKKQIAETEENKELFARIVISLADLFKRDPAPQYESLIQSWWDLLHKRISMEEFEQATHALKMTMYTMPVPRQVTDQILRERGEEVEYTEDPETQRDQRVLQEGRNLTKLLTLEERARMFRMADRKLKASMGTFYDTMAEATKSQVIEFEVARMLYNKEHKGRDK